MISYEMQKWIFKQSKKRKGWIYLMRYTDPIEITVNIKTGEQLPIYKWKYGKTTDLKKRMTYYSKDYELIESWKVNHLSLREKMIHDDWYIESSRDEFMQDYKDEHVLFNCHDIVRLYAEGEVIIHEEKVGDIDKLFYVKIGDGSTWRDLHSAMFNLIKII
jgi:hypothetical protein